MRPISYSVDLRKLHRAKHRALKEALNAMTFRSGRTRPTPSPIPREESIINSRRANWGGVEKSGQSNSSSSALQRRVARPLSKKELAIALVSIDPQFQLPRSQPTESPEQRILVVPRDPASSLYRFELVSTSHILSGQTYGYQLQQREPLPQSMPRLRFPTSTPFVQSCSNFLDSILTTAQERSFLRSMLPKIASATEDTPVQRGSQRGLGVVRTMPQFVTPSEVEYR